MKLLLSCLFIFFSIPCFGEVTPDAFQKFLREYLVARDVKEKTYWSEITYAIEKDYDEIAMFCLDNLYLGDINYMNLGHYYNLHCLCVRKNKFEILEAILSKYHHIPDGTEFYTTQKTGGLRLKERRILNIAIEDRSNSLEWVKLLIDYGANIHLCEDYRTGNGLGDLHYYRTPLAAAVFANKLDVAEFLLERKANPSDALITAVTSRNAPALVLLLNYGADPYHGNGWILNEAIKLGYDEMVDILIDAYFSKQPTSA